MSMMKRIIRRCLVLSLLAVLCLTRLNSFAAGTNALFWDRENERVTADVRDWELVPMLEEVAAQSGWNIFLEPDYRHKASVKFKSLPPGEALRRLLGDMNFAMMPQTNGQQRLYVFRTALGNATQQMRASRPSPKPPRASRRPRQADARKSARNTCCARWCRRATSRRRRAMKRASRK